MSVHANRAAVLAAALLTGCGGGGGSHAAPAVRHVATTSVTFHIAPSKAAASRKRRPTYVSLGTQSARVDISSDGVPTTTTVVRCSFGSCDGTVDAPVATDTFAIALYDDWTAQGKLLSAGRTTQTILPGVANSVNVTFDAVPVHVVALSIGPPNPLIGSPSTTAVNVGAVDADGYTIIGPGKYDPPITLTLSDPFGATRLSETTVGAPNDVVTIAYDGTPKILATLTAFVQGDAQQQTAVFEPANVSKEYAIPGLEGPKAFAPVDITPGPDGALWFAEGGDTKIGRIDAGGNIKEFAVSGSPTSIVAGPDGALWFSEQNASVHVGRITPGGAVTEYAVAAPGGTPVSAVRVAFGADGNLYVADAANAAVYALDPATGATRASYATSSAPASLASGPDGNMWAGVKGAVVRIALASGVVAAFPTAGTVRSLVAGTDGNVWFTDAAGKIGSVTPSGVVTESAIPQYADAAYGIVAATDGTYWFTYGIAGGGNERSCRIGHASGGAIASYAIADCVTSALAFGPDHNLWLAETRRSRIGIFSSF